MSAEPAGQASFLVLEAGFTLLAVVIAFCWPEAGSRWFAKVEEFFRGLARMRVASVITVGAAAILLRLAMLPLEPIPQPFIHDEFSYLLAADTFASGRLTNPTHPLWTHFESFHIDQQPSYMSMYFPAQGLMMAAGQVLFGRPWYGVLLSVGLMCAALCWALQGWLPPGWALLGGMLAVIRLGLFSNWVNGYYGGAISATGGALVLGALPRLKRRVNVRDAMVLACGAILLANSRPYEGLLVCGPAVAVLFFPAIQKPWSLVAPSILVLIAAGLMAHYNQRVFGSALTLPYQINRITYASAPVFLWEPPRPAPEYRSKEMHDFFQIWEMHDFRLAQHVARLPRQDCAESRDRCTLLFRPGSPDPDVHAAAIVPRPAHAVSPGGQRRIRDRIERERLVLSALCSSFYGGDLRSPAAMHAPLAPLHARQPARGSGSDSLGWCWSASCSPGCGFTPGR